MGVPGTDDPARAALLERLDAFCDGVPRDSATVEDHGPLRLFVPDGVPWALYARPAGAGLVDASPDLAGALASVRARQRELGLPQTLEWIAECDPALGPVAREAGYDVLEAPLMVLEPHRRPHPDPLTNIEIRLLGPGDAAVAPARGVADVAFGAAGTGPGPQGLTERDAAAAGQPGSVVEAVARRMGAGVLAIAVAETERGPVAVGSAQRAGDVVEITGLGTLPAVRRQGLGARVTAALIDAALDDGATTVFLSAQSDEVARLYGRLGFTRVGTACIASVAG